MSQYPHPSYADMQHYKRVGLLYTVFGYLILIPAVIFLVFLFFALFQGEAYTTFMLIILTVISGGLGLLYIITGRQSLKGKAWTRTVLIILGILALPGFPVGTVVGAYVLYVLLPEKSNGFYKN